MGGWCGRSTARCRGGARRRRGPGPSAPGGVGDPAAQVFRADVLREALDRDVTALAAATDDASLVEQMGRTVRVVEAPPDNFKITDESDLRIAEALLRERV